MNWIKFINPPNDTTEYELWPDSVEGIILFSVSL